MLKPSLAAAITLKRFSVPKGASEPLHLGVPTHFHERQMIPFGYEML
jgi:hypothetical protein